MRYYWITDKFIFIQIPRLNWLLEWNCSFMTCTFLDLVIIFQTCIGMVVRIRFFWIQISLLKNCVLDKYNSGQMYNGQLSAWIGHVWPQRFWTLMIIFNNFQNIVILLNFFSFWTISWSCEVWFLFVLLHGDGGSNTLLWIQICLLKNYDLDKCPSG